MAWRGESNSISEGTIASAPYTRKKGVNPVERFGVVRKLHSTAGNSSIPAPGALSTSLGLIPDKMRHLPALLDHWTGGEQPMLHPVECLTCLHTEPTHPLRICSVVRD